MFTGIITGVARIVAIHALGAADHGQRISLACPADYLHDVGLGDSIAIDGACMTVTSLEQELQQFSVDVSAESLARIAPWRGGQDTNLEKALRANDRLGGHLVSGHVDGTGSVTQFEEKGESWTLCILAPQALARFLAYKGSIVVQGVSLTVNEVQDQATGCSVRINLIPHTLQNTALGQLQVGARVNLEVDLIARYVERMLSAPALPATPRAA